MNKELSTSDRLNWTVFALRWLVVLGGLLTLGLPRDSIGSNATTALPATLIGVVFYNLLVALILLVGGRGPLINAGTVVLDMVAAVALFEASGSSPVMLVGAGLLPVVIGTRRYRAAVGVVIIALLAAGCLALAFLTGTLSTTFGSILASLLFLALGCGLAAVFNADAVRRMDDDAVDGESQGKPTEVAHLRARAVYEMANTLGATLDYNKVLDAALDVGALGLKNLESNSRLVGMVMLFEKNELCVVNSRRLTQRDEKMCVPGQQGILGQVLKKAEPIFAGDVSNDPELKYFVAFQDVRSVLAIPLRANFDNYGVLVFGTPDPNAFSEEQIELLTAIGTQATVALQNAVLYQNLRLEKERIVEVEEDARKKLSRDLHDGPTQSIAAIAMRVNYIRRLMETRPNEAVDELQKVEELARKTTKEIRSMLFTLRPLVLETQGLSPALQQFAEKMKETHNLDVIVQSQQGTDDLLESHAQGVLFYVVEEAVGNARKHAQAAHIWVRLYRQENYVIVEIQDDGVGFDLDAVNANYDQRGSLGMVNMRERAALAEGTLRIESAKGKGTKIQVIVPIKTTPDKRVNAQDNGADAAPSANNAVRTNLKISK
ncbi:MAG TPA: GAF domain-containing sensor histidine kinase [Aggregatilineales bacterium]|nr:GAF domain-containing sensor histidine kinase [Aggregatilineales bacterium]